MRKDFSARPRLEWMRTCQTDAAIRLRSGLGEARIEPSQERVLVPVAALDLLQLSERLLEAGSAGFERFDLMPRMSSARRRAPARTRR